MKIQINENKLHEMYVIQNKLQEEIANELGVSRFTIMRRIKQLGYKRLYQDCKWLKQMISEGKTIPEMMKLAHCSHETIRKYLRKYNLDVQDEVRYKHFRKYSANHNFFENIDTEEKAYWLGFILADGAILTTPNKPKTLRLQILLSEKDKTHIEKFLRTIKSNHPIKIDEIEVNGKKHKQARVRINGYKICKDLMRHNVYPNKSTVEQVVENLPPHLIQHYLRGYFDGDGSFSEWISIKNRPISSFTIVGSKEVVQFFTKQLQDLFSKSPIIKQEGKIYVLTVGGNPQVQRIMDYLYNNATVYLDRKYHHYQEWKNSIQ